HLVSIEPVDHFLALFKHPLLVLLTNLAFQLVILHSLLDVVCIGFQGIFGNYSFSVSLILYLITLCFLHHAINVIFAEAAFVISYCNLVLFSCALVHCSNIEDTICIYVECHLNLGHTTRCRWNTCQVKLAQQVVVLGHGSLTLIHLYQHTTLVVKVWVCLVGIVVLRLIKAVITPPAVSIPRESGATSSSRRSCTFSDLSPIRIAACTAAPYATASSGFMLLFSSFPLKKSWSNFWILGIRVEPPTRTISLICPLSSLASRRAFSTGSRVPRKRSALSSSKRARKPGWRTQGTFGSLTGCTEPSNCSLIASNVTLMLALEFLHKVTHHAIVKVLPTQVGISSSRFHFKDAIFNGQNGNIKCATTQVKDQYILLTCSAPFFIQTIGNGSSRGLINDAQYVETCNGTCIFGGLTLGVIEVCRYSNYSTLDFATQVSLGYFLHFGQYHRGNFFRKEVLGLTLVLDLHLGLPSFAHHTERPVLHIGLHRRVIKFAANETLGIEDGIVRIHSHLILGCISDKPFSVRKGNVARCSAVALVVGDNLHFPMLENSDAGVRGAQVNAYGRRFRRHGCRNAIKISL
ncbi:hypothetical protein E2320_021724, partial [Naja naja]